MILIISGIALVIGAIIFFIRMISLDSDLLAVMGLAIIITSIVLGFLILGSIIETSSVYESINDGCIIEKNVNSVVILTNSYGNRLITSAWVMDKIRGDEKIYRCEYKNSYGITVRKEIVIKVRKDGYY